MKTRGKTTLTSVLVLALTTAACGGGDDDGDASAQMYTWVSNESDREQWQAFIDAAQEEDPEFALELEGPSFEDYWTTVRTRMGASDAPCILTTQSARAQELDDLLLPLDDLADEAGLDLGQYNDAMLQGMTVDGTLRAIPYDASPLVLYYNKDIYENAGLDDPEIGYTTDQYLSDMQDIAATGINAISIPPAIEMSPGFAIAFSNGNPAVENDELQLTAPEFVEDMQWGYDLVAEHELASAPSAGDARDIGFQNFIGGNAASVIEGPWQYTTIMEQTDAEVGVTTVPTDSGDPAGMIQGSGFGIAETCDDPEAAFENIMAITTPEVVGYLGSDQGNIPSIESEIDQWGENRTDEALEAVEIQLENGLPLETTADWNQIDNAFVQSLSAGYQGRESAEEILTSIQDSGQ